MDEWVTWLTIGVAALTTAVGELLRPRARKDEGEAPAKVRVKRVYGVHGIVVGYRYFVGDVETDVSGHPLLTATMAEKILHGRRQGSALRATGMHEAYRHALGLPSVVWYGDHRKLLPVNLARARAMWVSGKKQKKVTT